MKKRTTLTMACALGTTMLLGCIQAPQAMPSMPPVKPVAVNLQSHHWVLDSATNRNGANDAQWTLPATSTQPQRAITINFVDAQILTVRGLCNVMNGRYMLDGNNIKVDQLVSTMMACNQPGLMELEQKVGKQLPHARTWEIQADTPPRLALSFADGASWVFKGMPTHETLYGQSERVFLEVGAQKVACNSPVMPKAQCLQVRELQYDNGLKKAATQWQTFAGEIEGFTHQPGVRNVLRLNRYTRSDTPADAPRYLYVLDMAIESEIIR